MTAKLNAAANIIRESAVEFLATKHGVTIDAIIDAICSGNVKVCDQFAVLVAKGIEEAMQLAAIGKISLI